MTLIVGTLSGIQDFLFDVPNDGGGQARMLRARSFWLQTLAECGAFLVLERLRLPERALQFVAAGKFCVMADAVDGLDEQIGALQREIDHRLRDETVGRIRLFLAVADNSASGEMIGAQYNHVMRALLRAKAQPSRALAVSGGQWQPQELIVQGHANRPQTTAADDEKWGKRLPEAEWLMFRRNPSSAGSAAPRAANRPASRTILGLDVELIDRQQTKQFSANDAADPSIGRIIALDTVNPPHTPATNVIRRQLARYVPTHRNSTPIMFSEIARHARGDHLLGVLKMDADNLGVAVREKLNECRTDLQPLCELSAALDTFFAAQIDRMIRADSLRADSQWKYLYTIFSGGDDLLVVGPWNTIIDFAGVVQNEFHNCFGHARSVTVLMDLDAKGDYKPRADSPHSAPKNLPQLTISAGIALVKPRLPIRHGANEAEELLTEGAKKQIAPGERDPKNQIPKDQIAALGQIWKWKHHAEIIKRAKQLADWVDARDNRGERLMQRGWLHSLLRFALDRLALPTSPDPDVRKARLLAPSRLAYTIGRNFPSGSDPNPQRREIRQWADRLIAEFESIDATSNLDVAYLPAILRYALTATRTSQEN